MLPDLIPRRERLTVIVNVQGEGGRAAAQVPPRVPASYGLNSSCVKVGEIELIAPASTPEPPTTLSRYAM